MIERLPGRERKEGEENVGRNLCPFGCVCVKDSDTCLVGFSVGWLLGLGGGIITAYGVGKGPKVKKSPQGTRLFIYLQGMKKNMREREREREYQKVEDGGERVFASLSVRRRWVVFDVWLSFVCFSSTSSRV